MSDSRQKDRRNALVNLAILATLAIILLSPSGVIGSWLATQYKGWKSRQTVARLWPSLEAAPSRLTAAGDAGVATTIVEFIDYECPSCRLVAETVSEAVESGQAEVVVRHFPLTMIHPNARGAALAAICSERFGRFKEAHHDLLTDESWMEGPAWTSWAHRVGIDDAAAFAACLDDPATADRLSRDIELAEEVGVVGTPSFVTTQGVFGGYAGFEAAIVEGGRPERSVPRRALSATAVFDSGQHPDPAVATLGDVGRGAILAEDRIVVLDDTRLLFLDPTTGALLNTAGGSGGGPGEFRVGGAAQYWASRKGNLAIWDAVSMRLTEHSSDGELLQTKTLPSAPAANQSFRGPGPYFTPVGIFNDGALAFAEWPQSGSEDRPMIDIMEAAWDGHLRTITSVPANQGMSILFGYRTSVSVIDDELVVADNETDSIRAYDRSGAPRFSIPMPGRIERVTDARFGAALEARRRRDEGLLSRRLGMTRERVYVPNEVVPPISYIRADSEGRLWVRHYTLPESDAQRWTVWQRTSLLFTLEMPGKWLWLDARDDLVLLSDTGRLVPNAVLHRLVEAGSPTSTHGVTQ